MRREKPSYRVRRALARITRDKWLSGDEVSHVARCLSMCAAGSAWPIVYKSCMAYECTIVGMIRGNPPAFVSEVHYGEVMKAVKRIKQAKHKAPEIELLKTVRCQYENDR